MHVLVVFAHPSRRSFSRAVLEVFVRGLAEAGHSYEVADLYEESFQSEMDDGQYLRETCGDPDRPVPPDVASEQERINRASGLVFIYPVWWSDCPAKLKGWFDRVMTCGYAYFYDARGERGSRLNIAKALVICSAGHTAEHLEETGIAEGMRRVMLGDRLLGIGIREASMVVLGGMMPLDDSHREENLRRAYQLGRDF
jgi:NAD(P)H dehydrogenase (quinone)